MPYAIIDFKKKKIFDKIEVNENEDEIKIKIPEFKESKQQKYAHKVNNILKKYKVSNVVLSEKFKELIDFENIIMEKNHYIITGKKLYKVLIPTIISDISNYTKFQKEKLNIAILIDEYNADNIELIKMLADEVKSVTLITNNAYRFEELVDELLRSKGIVVQLLNKGKINLKRKQIIINIDFSDTDVEKLNLPTESILITNNRKIQKTKNNFNGIVIRDVDIYLNENISNFRSIELCEAYIYNYMKRIKENELIFNASEYKINGYIGNNGKILQEDFERLGKAFLTKRKSFSK